MNSEELRQSCKEFAEFYYEDINEKELEIECLHLTEYLKIVDSEKTDSILKIYQLLKDNKIEGTFPNVEIALRTLLLEIKKN